jgi:argonaute-like protein implicated in RNA metabolism and viral defense
MCDPKGGEIDWKPVGVPFAGRYIDEKWFEGFLRFVRDNVRPGVRRIVVFRKGDTYENERKAMEKVVAGLTEGPWNDFNFVSVINEERRIIALQEMAENPESGVFVNLNDKEAILVCSLQHGITLQQGTTIPIRLVKVIGKSSIEKIVSEYRALTYLNWASPILTSKYPLVVNIANRIAQLVKEQSDVKMLETYLPL